MSGFRGFPAPVAAMDTPTPTPEPPAPAPPPEPAISPPPLEGKGDGGFGNAPASRPAQLALGVFLVFTLGLLALRGYGNSFGAKPTDPAVAALTDLNHADRAELEQVPGIGPTLAREIDEHRRKKGPFQSVEQLRQVKGVGQITLDKVRPFVRVEPTASPPSEPPSPEPLVLERKPTKPATPAPYPRTGGGGRKLQPGDPPVDVNAASVEQLMTIPGVGPVTAQNIVNARADKPFKSVADLGHVKGIGPKTLEKIRPFVIVK
jgi:competence protein ComEA